MNKNIKQKIGGILRLVGAIKAMFDVRKLKPKTFVEDPGHLYNIKVFDGVFNETTKLRFVKRQGSNYPGNEDAYAGTIMQEVLRACIDRVKYVDAQISDASNAVVIADLRNAILNLELRAARRHNAEIDWQHGVNIENQPTQENGHIYWKS